VFSYLLLFLVALAVLVRAGRSFLYVTESLFNLKLNSTFIISPYLLVSLVFEPPFVVGVATACLLFPCYGFTIQHSVQYVNRFYQKNLKKFIAEKRTLHCITKNTVFKKFLDAGSIENTTFLKSLGSKNFVKT
jgi:hypothetical protein